jgi:hypothetical protein
MVILIACDKVVLGKLQTFFELKGFETKFSNTKAPQHSTVMLSKRLRFVYLLAASNVASFVIASAAFILAFNGFAPFLQREHASTDLRQSLVSIPTIASHKHVVHARLAPLPDLLALLCHFHYLSLSF